MSVPGVAESGPLFDTDTTSAANTDAVVANATTNNEASRRAGRSTSSFVSARESYRNQSCVCRVVGRLPIHPFFRNQISMKIAVTAISPSAYQ